MGLRRKARELHRWISSRSRARNGILLYHRVDEPVHDPFRLCVTPENFSDQMEWIAYSGRAVTLSDLEAGQRNGTIAPGKIAVTFDDGYLDVLENALPILERFEVPATLFVTTGNLGKPFWWDRLAFAVLLAPSLPESLPLDRKRGTSLLTSSHSRKSLFDESTRILRTFPPEGREATLASWEERIPAPSLGENQRCQSAEELRRLAQHPLIEIGAHTVSHTRLTTLPHEEQVREIAGSAQSLARLLGRPIETFSYPFGLAGRDFDSDTRAAVKESGIRVALAADRGVVTADSDPLALPRLWVHDRNRDAFQREMEAWV